MAPVQLPGSELPGAVPAGKAGQSDLPGAVAVRAAVPPGAEVADPERIGQPLEADALLDAVRRHLADALTVHRGRTRLREGVATAVQPGAAPALNEQIPDRPIDGLGEFVASEAGTETDSWQLRRRGASEMRRARDQGQLNSGGVTRSATAVARR